MRPLVFRYSGDVASAVQVLERLGADGEPEVLTPAGVSSPRKLAALGGSDPALAFLGRPPADEIGYWLAPLVALLTRPKRVVVVDDAAHRASVKSAARFVAEAAPLAAAQIATLPTALAAQRVLATVAGRRPKPTRVRRARSRAAVYLRAVVGTPEALGGSITHSHEVIRALRGLGVEVDPVTTDHEIAATAASEPDAPCAWRLVRPDRRLRALPASAGLAGDLALVRAAYASAIGADFIYQRHARFSICGALLSRLTGRPLILEFNGSEAWVQRHWQPTPLTGQLLRCESSALAAAACIVVVSDAERRTLERRGIASHRILVNPNGVDVDRFARGGGRQRRHALGFGDDDFVVGFVGTFGPWHGAPVLARAFGALAAREPRARLLLVGDGPERSAVREELARNSSLDRAVLIERVPPADVPELLDACDALASPHVWRPDSGEFFGSPTKLFEYMASAKPIVASRLGQIAEVLEHERTALLVESGDADALAGALERLAREPALGERLGQAARVAAGDSHSWRLNAQRVLSAYDRIVSTSGIRSERA